MALLKAKLSQATRSPAPTPQLGAGFAPLLLAVPLAEAQQRADALSGEAEALRAMVTTLEAEAEQRSADLAAALARARG